MTREEGLGVAAFTIEDGRHPQPGDIGVKGRMILQHARSQVPSGRYRHQSAWAMKLTLGNMTGNPTCAQAANNLRLAGSSNIRSRP